MTQRRKRSLNDLKGTWGSKKRENTPQAEKRKDLATSHTESAQNVPNPRLSRAPKVVPAVRAPAPKPPAKSSTPKRIYLNTVLTAELEARLERAVKFYQRTHGKAFGRSAYGRKALIAQLERDGF